MTTAFDSARRPWGDWLVLAGGLLITASSAAHAFLGLPALMGGLAEISAGEEVRETVAIGWSYGSAAMLAFGMLSLLAFADLPRGDRLAFRVALVIGVAYVLFGAGACAYAGVSGHFIGFVLIGLLLAIGAVQGKRRPRGAA